MEFGKILESSTLKSSQFNKLNTDNPHNHTDYFIHKEKSCFSDNTLLDNLIKVTQAKPYIPLQLFYQLYNFLEKNQQHVNSLQNLSDSWNDIQFQLLLPIEDQIKSDLSITNINNEAPKYPQSIRTLVQKLNAFQVILIANFPAMERHFIELFAEATKYYEKFVEGLMKVASESPKDLEEYLKPKPIMTTNLTNEGKFFIISQKIVKLITKPVNVTEAANHIVNGLPANDPIIHFKCYFNDGVTPRLNVNTQEQLIALYDILNIQVPLCGMIVITNHDTNRGNKLPIMILISESVKGPNPLEVLNEIPNNFNYGQQVLGAILTNPNDGKIDNFIYSTSHESLISIDNDEVFYPELVLKSRCYLNIKTILFTFKHMQSVIDTSISKLIMSRSCNLITSQ